MDALRRAAAEVLAEFGEEPAQQDGAIERVSLDVQLGRQTELVSLRVLQGRLLASCSCAQPHCQHLRVALQLLAAKAGFSDPPQRTSSRAERSSAELRIPARVAQAAGLSEALADVVTAVVRAGVASDRVASVLETLSRVEAAAGTPPPSGLLRWLGRIREALEARDVPLAAQALDGAAALSSDLRETAPNAEAQARIVTWLGSESSNELERLSDRSMLEVAREWVHGAERHQIERRYLVDLHSGEIFREECVRRDSMSSLGPCPRLVGVSLAEAERGAAPRRMRLLQYTTTPQVDRASWDLLAAVGQRDSDALAASYRGTLNRFGALCEPFVVVAPRGLQPLPAPALTLDHGAPLPLGEADEPGVLARFTNMLAGSPLAWVAGRLHQQSGAMMLKPLAAGLVEADRIRHERL